jgi:hypothetical protein
MLEIHMARKAPFETHNEMNQNKTTSDIVHPFPASLYNTSVLKIIGM